jgi:type IV pilus assembly protein PilA
MTCQRCGAVNEPSVAFCVRCGERLSPSPSNAAGRKGLAITAMVLGIASFPLMCAFGLGLVPAIAAVVCGIVALVKVNRYPAQYGGKGFAIAGLVTGGVACLLAPVMVAVIALPSFLRARTAANESGAVGDVRTMISAQVTYASSNGGYYDKLECLARPQGCIPGSSAPAQALIDGSIASMPVRRGYDFTLHLGPAAPQENASAVSPSSVTSFAYVAVPVKAGNTGQRAFCGDETGVVRVSPSGMAPTIFGGKCPEDWSIQ